MILKVIESGINRISLGAQSLNNRQLNNMAVFMI